MANVKFPQLAPRVVIGLVLVSLGILFSLDKMGFTDAEGMFRYWPALLILFGVGKILQPRGRAFGGLLIFLGFWLQLYKLGFVGPSPWDFWPLLLILVGGFLILKSIGARKAGRDDGGSGPHLNASAFLGGSRHRVHSADFRGGEATAILGGCVIDLKDATPGTGETVIDTFAFWGSVEILVGDDWEVEIRGKPFLGSFEDNRSRGGSGATKRLVVTGLAIMGGVEVKN